jgi:hypothetical protein
MKTTPILTAIEAAFPLVEMPATTELTVHLSDCMDCDSVRKDLDDHRGEEVSGKIIRMAHCFLCVLSPQAIQWLLPHYLRFCFTPEAEYNRMETESLICSLSPDVAFQEDTAQRLSLLSRDQIKCLVNFLKNRLNDEYWNEQCAEEIKNGIIFLEKLLLERG